MITYTDCHVPSNSTAVNGIYFDATSDTMYVIYTGGQTYRYDGVDYADFERIAEAQSVGHAMNKFRFSFSGGSRSLGIMWGDDFEQAEDDNVVAFPDFNSNANKVRKDAGLKEGNIVYLASKNLTMPTSTNTYEVEFRMDLTGDRTFSHFTKATSIEDAISKLSIISDALESVLTILSVKVIYERN